MFRSLTKSARGQYLRWSKDSEEGKTGRVPSFGRWRKWDSERWSALPKVTQLVKVRVQILVIWLQSKGSFLFLLLLGGGGCTSNDKIEIPLCLVLLSYLPCTVTAAAPNSSLDPWDFFTSLLLAVTSLTVLSLHGLMGSSGSPGPMACFSKLAGLAPLPGKLMELWDAVQISLKYHPLS